LYLVVQLREQLLYTVLSWVFYVQLQMMMSNDVVDLNLKSPT